MFSRKSCTYNYAFHFICVIDETVLFHKKITEYRFITLLEISDKFSSNDFVVLG